jgi:EpsD family peptidyl-prolyl cis-trans isomerase
MKRFPKWTPLACLVLVGGCNQEATGQVAAVVNGEEITLQELNAELESLPIPEGGDRKVLQQAALQRVLERRLLAQEAREDGLDQSPEFLIRRRQLEDNLLVQLMARTAERGSEVPSQRAIDTYMSSNPALFANRTVYTLDRIQFPVPSNASQLRALESAGTMDEVATQLRAMGIEFTRAPSRMDSAQVGQQLLERIRALPPGEPFIIPEGGGVTVAVITGEAKQPISGDQARPLAIQAMRNTKVMESLQQRLKTARAEAEIEYQTGFAPPAPGAQRNRAPRAG